MCICCCFTRKSLLIYAIIVTSIAFIYGIVAISLFVSKTDEYKRIKTILDMCDANSNYKPWGNNYRRLEHKEPSPLAAKYLKTNTEKRKLVGCDGSYGVLKNLKAIENGLGTVLFIFPILFLVAEIIYLIFTCGISENQVVSLTTFNVFNILKTTTYTISIIFIFLSILYGILLFFALMQYYSFYPDSITYDGQCAGGIVYGMIFGYYSFYFYITLATILGRERAYFLEVGSQEKPGPRAEYDINGNMIARAVVTQQVVTVPQMVVQPMAVPYQQVPVVNTNPMYQNPTVYSRPSQVNMMSPEQQQQMQTQNQMMTSERNMQNDVLKPNNQ